MLSEPMDTVPSAQLGKAARMVDAPAGMWSSARIRFRGAELKRTAVGPGLAHGATYQVAPQVFTELGATVVVIGAEPDGYNINRDVGSTSPAALQARVLSEQADLGIAFDGDGDRVQCVAADGTVVDGDELLYVIANDRVRRGRPPEGVVGTLMSNLGLEQALADKGIELVRARWETATCSNKWRSRVGLWEARLPDTLFVLISPRPAMASWPRYKLWRPWRLRVRAFWR